MVRRSRRPASSKKNDSSKEAQLSKTPTINKEALSSRTAQLVTKFLKVNKVLKKVSSCWCNPQVPKVPWLLFKVVPSCQWPPQIPKVPRLPLKVVSSCQQRPQAFKVSRLLLKVVSRRRYHLQGTKGAWHSRVPLTLKGGNKALRQTPTSSWLSSSPPVWRTST